MSKYWSRKKRPPEERFWEKVDKTETCWLWLASTKHGYGAFGPSAGRIIPAHRYAYQLLIGPIPKGLVLDHLCRVRHCVNPEHLRVTTHRENILAGAGATAKHAIKTHCKNGHPFTPENTFASNATGGRGCRICRYIRMKVYLPKWKARQEH